MNIGAKLAERRKDVLSWILIAFVLVLVGIATYFILEPRLRPHVTVRAGDGVFSAQVAKTEEARKKGLSDRSNLNNEEAMLFVFETDSKWPMWMKDMHFPIDIVWLDKSKKVVYIVKNAPPDSYPGETFTPAQETRYVLEFTAGTVDRKAIMVGSEVKFDENSLEGGR